MYYKDPVIDELTPNKGPMVGGTQTKMIGVGYRSPCGCNVTVRYGAVVQEITNVTNFTDTEIPIVSPPSNVPARVQVSVSLNGQQYLNDKVFHIKDPQTIFTYYQDSFVTDYTPKLGPVNGGSVMRFDGMGFQQFKDENGERKIEPTFVRFRDAQTNETIGIVQAYD